MPDNAIREEVVLARLTEAAIPHRRLVVGRGVSVVAAAVGARVYGPFVDGGPALNWMPAAFGNPDAFAALVASDDWNLGGDRLWIGPEIQYIVEDRADYWGSFVVPPAMDPGLYVLAPDFATFSASAVFTARNTQTGELGLSWRATVTPAGEPLRGRTDADGLLSGVRAGGYAIDVALTVAEPGLHVESWYLDQMNTPGRVLVPATPALEVTDYYEPVGELLMSRPGGIEVELTGADRFKIGFDAASAFGRMGYRRSLPTGEELLVVRHVTHHPAAAYPEEPDFAPGVRGDSLHVYSDPGGLGGFGELEARGSTIGVEVLSGVDRFSTWVYVGSAARIDRISEVLLGLV